MKPTCPHCAQPLPLLKRLSPVKKPSVAAKKAVADLKKRLNKILVALLLKYLFRSLTLLKVRRRGSLAKE